MAGQNDTTINIGIKADLAGGVQTEKQLDTIRKKAVELGKDTNSAANSSVGAFGRMKSAAGALRSVLSGFGVVGIFSGLISAVAGVARSFRDARKSAEEFHKAEQDAADAASIRKLEQEYGRLSSAIEESTRRQERLNQIFQEQVKARRMLEDEKSAGEEDAEIAALDRNAPDYEERVALIRAYHDRDRMVRSASRESENVSLERQRLQDEATAKKRAAEAEDARTKALDAKAEAAENERMDTVKRSFQLNEHDKPELGFWGGWGANLKQFLTGDWGRETGHTAEGDQIRAQAKKDVPAAEAKAEEARSAAEESRKKAEELREEAKDLEERARAVDSQDEAIRLRIERADRSGTEGINTARRALESKQEQIARDTQTISGADSRRAHIQARIDEQAALERAAAERANKEDREAELARQALADADLRHRGTKGWSRYANGERKGLESDLQREENEAKEASLEYGRTRESVAGILKNLNEEMRRFEAELKAAESRMKVNSDTGNSK